MVPVETIDGGFAAVYDRYADMLYRIALSYLGQRENAEDAVHDVFVRWWQVTPLVKDAEHERAWLIRATVNRCTDIARRNKIRRYEPLESVEYLAAPEPEETVVHLVSGLPEKLRSVILLHYLEGFSVEETAKLLGLSLSAVKMRLLRGREILKEQLTEE